MLRAQAVFVTSAVLGRIYASFYVPQLLHMDYGIGSMVRQEDFLHLTVNVGRYIRSCLPKSALQAA